MSIIPRRRWVVVLACVVAGVGVTGDRGGSEKHRGMSYAHEWRRAEDLGYGSARSRASLARLKELGVNWISITPFGFQSTPRDTTIRWGGARFSESDDRLRRVTAQAHEVGIKVMLKPHLWLRPPAWVGVIDQETERDRAAWFEAYRAFAIHYATLAAQAGMDAFCIGNELEKTTRHEAAWRSLIHDVRAVYRGPITYGAGGEEAPAIKFWDALDYIGISAYYPLVDARSPDRRALVAAWVPITKNLAVLSARWKKPILFTELGYRSADFAAWKQWEVGRTAPVNQQLQADAYAAFFEAVWPQPWFAGVYWWKWVSYLDDGGADDNDYTPRHKTAEVALAQYYGGK